MTWMQREIRLNPRERGFHLIGDELLQQLPEISSFEIGTAHIFITHTSASLALNENADPSVRRDMESFFNRLVPERAAYFTHTFEGPDDMPAHIKAVVLGPSLMLPIRNGSFLTGTWQGVYLCEHRNHGGSRRLVVTLNGKRKGS